MGQARGPAPTISPNKHSRFRVHIITKNAPDVNNHIHAIVWNGGFVPRRGTPPWLPGLPTVVARLPTVVARLPTLVARLPTVVARLPTLVARLPPVVARLPTVVARLPTLVTRLPTLRLPGCPPCGYPVAHPAVTPNPGNHRGLPLRDYDNAVNVVGHDLTCVDINARIMPGDVIPYGLDH